MKCSELKQELEKYIKEYGDFDVSLFVVTPTGSYTCEDINIEFQNDCFVVNSWIGNEE